MSDFKWAYGQNANVREPITNLKEKGWQYADVPTASNFNWSFNQVQKELEKVSHDLAGLKETISIEIKAIKESATAIKKTADDAMKKSIANERDIEFYTGISRQMCSLLRVMEQHIQRHHPGFPTQPWPLTDNARPRIAENEESVTLTEA
jgi:hypothetical protein